ncbi:hypothetical protein DPMN_049745 [Dreissena polymorpha]|uniref:Uncharacterized protein n=1 Tax=Dreissena polymorpha TaxID=45954 RepID=A0A9D4CFG4_DREPO|nr:hypothetical protein DPMN_049745 [Dreissena polymorpha]
MMYKKRIKDKVGMGKKMVLEEGDPRRLAKHLAPESPPSTSAIVQAKQTRFKRK